jgi:hypothetical protein
MLGIQPPESELLLSVLKWAHHQQDPSTPTVVVSLTHTEPRDLRISTMPSNKVDNSSHTPLLHIPNNILPPPTPPINHRVMHLLRHRTPPSLVLGGLVTSWLLLWGNQQSLLPCHIDMHLSIQSIVSMIMIIWIRQRNIDIVIHIHIPLQHLAMDGIHSPTHLIMLDQDLKGHEVIQDLACRISLLTRTRIPKWYTTIIITIIIIPPKDLPGYMDIPLLLLLHLPTGN